MAVFFVYRSHYDDPAGKRLKRFDDRTVLDWFRNHWAELRAGKYARLKKLLGFSIYGFSSLFEVADEEDLPPPESDEELGEYLEAHLYSEGPILYQPHLLTVQTDDDELEVCYYVFDDLYLAEHGPRAAYLLNEGWQLPTSFADAGGFVPSEPTDDRAPAGKGQGAVYLFFNCYADSGNLTDSSVPTSRINGIRLPDMVRYLSGPPVTDSLSEYLLLLRAQLLADPITTDPVEAGFRQAILDNPDDDASWAAYSDWLQERGQRRAGLELLEKALTAAARLPVLDLPNAAWEAVRQGSVTEVREALQPLLAASSGRKAFAPSARKTRVLVTEHLAQLCLHTGRWDKVDLYHQWIFFDDLWATAHPDLANALLRYDRCWDVLSPDGPHEEDE